MNYSQNNEQELILNYFKDRKGNVLDVGSNDGKSLSNSLAVIERGWGGVLIEPSLTAFKKLSQLHKDRTNVECFNIAIGKENGEADFYESGEHLGTGDTALISTLVKSETDRWKGSKFDNFTTTKVNVMTWESFYASIKQKTFELISIDCEGLDLYILSQMDLVAMKCEMLIVEWNGKDFLIFDEIATEAGLILHSKNAENLIFAK